VELKDRLAALRRERGLSLRQLREQIETKTAERIAVSYLSSLERLDATPSVEVLTKIAAGYGMTVQELLAPVDFTGESQPGDLPSGLQEFARANPNLSADQIHSLARVEFRGARPETAAEWEQLYKVLDALLGPKVKE
jgi:transcriptional regulator with XRE-family HTH domain